MLRSHTRRIDRDKKRATYLAFCFVAPLRVLQRDGGQFSCWARFRNTRPETTCRRVERQHELLDWTSARGPDRHMRMVSSNRHNPLGSPKTPPLILVDTRQPNKALRYRCLLECTHTDDAHLTTNIAHELKTYYQHN
jgi:hypothetical protein